MDGQKSDNDVSEGYGDTSAIDMEEASLKDIKESAGDEQSISLSFESCMKGDDNTLIDEKPATK